MAAANPPDAAAQEIAERVHRAREAQAVWVRYTLTERVARLRSLWAEIGASREALLRIIQEETGKPIAEIETLELGAAELILKYFTRNAHRILKDRAVPRPWLFFNKRAYVRFKPRGVAGIVGSWHLPFLRTFADAVPALLAGNAVVVKPSEWTQRSALWLEEKMKVSGLFPEDLFQVAVGSAAAGATLAGAADILLFTGSAPDGRQAARAAVDRMKPVVIELDGKHPMVVLKDAFIARAAKAAVWGRFADGGQLHVGVGRVFVEEDAYPAFCEAVEAETKSLRRNVDGGAETELGRMVHRAQFELAQEHLKDARECGGRVIGGDPLDAAKLVMDPAIVFDANPEMRLMREDCFGPVLTVMPVPSPEEALRLANAGSGLAASLWSRDIARAETLSAYFEAGLIAVNDLPIGEFIVCSLPFGGANASGLGRRHSEEGLRMFCEQQSVLVHEWPSNLPEFWWFPYKNWKTRLLALASRWS